MDNGIIQPTSEPKKSRRDSTSKNISGSHSSVDKSNQATPRTSKTKSSASNSRAKPENRSSKESKSAHKTSPLDSSEEKLNNTSHNSATRSRSQRKSQSNLSIEPIQAELAITDPESHYFNNDAAHTNTPEKPTRSSNTKSSSSKANSSNISRSKSKSPGAEEYKKKSFTTRISTNNNPEDTNQTIKKSSSKVQGKYKQKNKPSKGSKTDIEPDYPDNAYDANTFGNHDIFLNPVSYEPKTKNSPKQIPENNRTTNKNTTVLAQQPNTNGSENSEKGLVPKLEIISKKPPSRAPSEKLMESLPKLKEASQIYTGISRISITPDPDNTNRPPALRSFDPISSQLTKADFLPSLDNSKLPLRTTKQVATPISNDVTSSTSLPSKLDSSYPPHFSTSNASTNGGARVVTPIKGISNFTDSDLAPREKSHKLLTLNGTNTLSTRRFSEWMNVSSKVSNSTEEKDKRSNKVGKMVNRSQTDWLPRKVEYHERIWSNVTSVNDPNRILECKTGAGKESMRDFIHRQIASKKISASSICFEGNKDFCDYINEIKIQKITYGQWEYQRNIERAKRGMPNGLGFEPPHHILRGEPPSHILRGVYALQSNFNLQPNII